MKELADILAAYLPHTHAALATVVRVKGSAYRRPGARMLIQPDGSIVGGVSGGCLERDVIQRAGGVVVSGKSTIVRYDTARDPDSGTGYSLGCGGTIDILIEPLNTKAGIHFMHRLAMSQKNPLTVATIISKNHPHLPVGHRLWIDASQKPIGDFEHAEIESMARRTTHAANHKFEILGQTVEVFFEKLEPPTELIIFGAGNDALPLTEIARAVGWKTTVVDVGSMPLNVNSHDGAVLRCRIENVPEQIAVGDRTAVVIMTHHFNHDSLLIRWLARQHPAYVGLLGPRHRSQEILRGVDIPAIHFPVGLDLGAENPQEIALAIVAEITAVRHGRSGGMLSESQGPIHNGIPLENHTFSHELACPVAAS